MIKIVCQFEDFPKMLQQNQLDFWSLRENSVGEVFHSFFAMTPSSRGKFDFKIYKKFNLSLWRTAANAKKCSMSYETKIIYW